MSKPREIPWTIEEHTVIKHRLLDSYLSAWMPILYSQQLRTKKEQKLIYVDGFSGPGEYWCDETKTSKVKGSPVIVAEKANKYLDEDSNRKFLLLAIDSDNRCVQHLEKIISKLNRHNQKWLVLHQSFEDGMNNLFSYLDTATQGNAPMFFFIDPFGYSGFKISTLKKILSYPRTELFINFMHYDINRFLITEHSQEHLYDLFGTDEYKKAEKLNSDQKTSFLIELYCNQLKKLGGASYVLPFRLNTPGQGTRPRYFLVHASQHIKALKAMKDQMSKLSTQEFRFEAIGISSHEQFDLFEPTDENKLKNSLLKHIESVNGDSMLYEEVEEWAYEETAGVSKNIKSKLIELENENKIQINRLPKKRNSTVTEGAKIFIQTPSLI